MSQLIRTILTLGTVATAVLVPLFAGHALAAHASRYYLYSLAALAVSVVLGVVVVRGAVGSGSHHERSRGA
ncbi:MAG: hypothetical protein ACREM1_18285 [Longimicrobiales bacterium]